MRAVRAVTLGYQGFGNVGDEAILAGVERLLEGTGIQVSAVVGGDRAPIVAYPGVRRVLSRQLLPTPSAIRELRRARLLLLAGGGLIHDHWPIVIPRYLAWSLVARALGLRVAWIGVGVGPIRHTWARRLAAMAVRLSSLVTVRDEASLAWVRRIAPRVAASVVPDPAFFLPIPRTSGGAGTAIIVRRPVPSEAHLAPRLAHAIAGLARARAATGVPVTILTMELRHDDDYAAAIAAAGRGEHGAQGVQPEVRALRVEPGKALEELAGFDEAVSVRLHGLILCSLVGTPCLPIAYDDKVLGTAARLGLRDAAVPLGAASAELLEAGLECVRHGTTRAAVRAAVGELRDDGPRVAAMLTSLADG